MATFLNFFRMIHIHPILIIFILLSIITGTFVQLFILLFIVVIHELGHYLAAIFYNWRIHSIVLWVFGGVMKTEELGNKSIKEDIIVTVAGPLQHIVILFLISSFSFLLPDTVVQMALQFNLIIFLFNLLPIYPLDGGKLVFYTLSIFIPFRKAHSYTVVFSLFACISIMLLQVLLLPFTLSAFLLIIFLFIENRAEWKHHYYIFIRFLLNRLNNPPTLLKKEQLIVPAQYRLIDVFSLFKRNKTHEISVKDTMDTTLSEQQSLHLYFKEKKLTESIKDIVEEK